MLSRIATAWRALTDRQRKYARRTGIGMAISALVFALVVFALPTPLARWVIESQLDSIGVAHDGIDTVDIDLWNSEVRAGPVSFRANTARDGQVGLVGFDYSLGALFEGHAFLQRFFLSGVDIYIARHENGSITINGVSLQPAGEAEPAAPDEPGEAPWFGLGVERFEFTDSVLVFEDVTGGTLSVAMKSLTLDRLFTWTPEEPARFTLDGSVNDMILSLRGTIVAFGNPLRVTVHSTISGITIGRVTRFVGPSGLAREDGTLNTDVRYEYAFFADGRIEGAVNGVYRFADFAIATDAGDTATLAGADLRLKLDQRIKPDGSATAKGDFSLDASSINIDSVTGDSVDIGKATLTLADIALDKSTERRNTLFSYDSARTDGTAPAGGAVSLIGLAIDWARNLAIDAISYQMTVDGRPQLDLQDVRLAMAARGIVPAQTITVDSLKVDLGTIDSETVDAGFLAKFGVDATVTALASMQEGGGPSADIAKLRLASNAVDFSALRDETRLAFDVAVMLDSLKASDGNGAQASLDAFSLRSDAITIARTQDAAEASGPIDIGLDGLAATVSGAAGTTALRGGRLGLSITPLTLSAGTDAAAQFAGELSLDDVSVTRDGDTPLALSFASKRTKFRDIRIAPLGPEATLEGALATELAGLSVEAGTGDSVVTFTARSISNEAADIAVSGLSNETPSFKVTERLKFSDLRAGFPIARGSRGDVSLDAFEADLSPIKSAGAGISVLRSLSAVEAAGAGVSFKGNLAATGLAAATTGDTPDRVEIASVALTGLEAGGDSGIGVGALTVDGLRARLALPVPGGGSGGAGADVPALPDKAATTAEPAPAAGGGKALIAQPGQPVRIGRFTISSGATVAVIDDSFSPPFETAVAFDKLEVGPVDTTRPETRTNLALSATIGEAAPLRLDGWVRPFADDPQLDAKGRLESLNLPFLSPFVAKLVGVNIESGDLTADVRAATDAQGLDGQIDVLVHDLFVVPISEKEAVRLEASVGLPVGFAVSVLKNGDGVIDLGFPVSGSVADPSVDFSEAINKAISGALASVFPLNWFGKDGNSFSMQPAVFVPVTDTLTEDGQAVARDMGELIAAKPDIRIRVCGRAARDDLLALRGEAGETEKTSEKPPAPVDASAGPSPSAPAPASAAAPMAAELRVPDEKEIEALLALAQLRGAAIRKFLADEYGVDPERLPKCRTTYSIDDGKAPRAEFQF